MIIVENSHCERSEAISNLSIGEFMRLPQSFTNNFKESWQSGLALTLLGRGDAVGASPNSHGMTLLDAKTAVRINPDSHGMTQFNGRVRTEIQRSVFDTSSLTRIAIEGVRW